MRKAATDYTDFYNLFNQCNQAIRGVFRAFAFSRKYAALVGNNQGDTHSIRLFGSKVYY